MRREKSASGALVIGEALIDVIDGIPVPGGSAANVALGLARRAIPTCFATHLGDDEYGRAIAHHLAASGVVIAPSSFTAARTSTAVVTRQDNGDASYAFDVGWKTPDLSFVPPAEGIHVGAFAAFSLNGREALLAFLAGHPDSVISFDPNVREALFPPHESALTLFDQIARLASVIKLSDEDAAWLFPGLELDRVADDLLGRGARLVVITMGSEGMHLRSATDRVTVPAATVRVSDSVGAGDTVMTSLIADSLEFGLDSLSADDLTAMGLRAASAAAITVGRAGADLPYLHEL